MKLYIHVSIIILILPSTNILVVTFIALYTQLLLRSDHVNHTILPLGISFTLTLH